MRFVTVLLFWIAVCSYGEESQQSSKIKIAVVSSSSIIGRYSHSTYNVALATFIALNPSFELINYPMKDESYASLSETLSKTDAEHIDAIIAPLTLSGVQNLLKLSPITPTFIPTVHKRDVGSAPANFTFGAIDYQAQIAELSRYMVPSVAVFYDDSSVGDVLNKVTQAVAYSSNPKVKNISSYRVDAKGSDIVKHLSKAGSFSNKSIIIHLPVVKTAMLAAHLTFTGVKKHTILSTQMNFDPTILSLTQYNDRKNMIVANSIIEQIPAIFESNALMNNDLTFDWINYTTSVGADFLISQLYGVPRSYTMRVIEGQVIYPVELMRPHEFGFEPFKGK